MSRDWIRICFVLFFCFNILDCLSTDHQNTKLKWQDSDFAIFQIENPSWKNFDHLSEGNQPPSFCKNWNSSSIKDILQSTMVVQTSLISNTPSAIFDRVELYASLSESLTQIIIEKNNQALSSLYFIVIKENDDLAPYTRILRTSFYFYCDQESIILYYGEIRDSMSYQAPYTFNDWVNTPLFQIVPNEKSRITFIERNGYKANLLTKTLNGKNLYLDGIQWKKTSQLSNSFDKKNQTNSNSNPDKKSEIEERLETLNNLKRKGLISEQEYIEKRKKIIDEL